MWADEDEVLSTWSPSRIVGPGPATDRARWGEAVRRAGEWIPELSGIDF
jgi:glycerol kinase